MADVPVRAGFDTVPPVGILRITASRTYQVIEEDLDNAPFILRDAGGRDLALPPGHYYLRIRGVNTPRVILPGRVTAYDANAAWAR